MRPSFLENLDILRGLAALCVFAAHFSYFGYTGAYTNALRTLGHDGVMVFFVLSGLVIAWVAQTRYPTLKHYAVSRLSRLSCVVLPAIGLTVLLDVCGKALRPDLYSVFPYEAPVLRIIMHALYLNESWINVRLFSNGPLWSIAYEFWYYVLFGVAFYLRGMMRVLALVIASIIAGPLILLLAPVWLLGVLSYKGITSPNTAAYFDQIPTALPAVILGVLFIIEPFAPADLFLAQAITGGDVARLAFSAHLVSDYVKGAFIAVFLIRLSRTDKTAWAWARRGGLWLASFSFTLYAVHMPLIMAMRALGLYDPTRLSQALPVALVILGLSWALSLITEKQRGHVRAWLDRRFMIQAVGV